MQDLDDVLSMDGGPTLGQLLNAADKATDDDSTNTQDMPEISILSLLDFNRDKKGNLTTPKSTRRNVYTVLNKDSRWKDLIWEDLFKGTLMFGERTTRIRTTRASAFGWTRSTTYKSAQPMTLR